MTLEELAERTGLSVRTIRYYITQNLVPHPTSRGRGAEYGEEHLLRLEMVARLSRGNMPIARQREVLEKMDLDQIRRELGRAEKPPDPLSASEFIRDLLEKSAVSSSEVVPPSPPALSPAPRAPSETAGADPPTGRLRQEPARWTHWQLARGVELHVRSDEEKYYEPLIQQVLETARRYRYSRKT